MMPNWTDSATGVYESSTNLELISSIAPKQMIPTAIRLLNEGIGAWLLTEMRLFSLATELTHDEGSAVNSLDRWVSLPRVMEARSKLDSVAAILVRYQKEFEAGFQSMREYETVKVKLQRLPRWRLWLAQRLLGVDL